MILRPRQKILVERSLVALKEHGNTLAVAPTGAGKTIMLSGVTGQWLADSGAKACVLAHRDELISQNESKFRRVNPGLSTSIFDAQDKSWAGQTTFAMVQTLCRESSLKRMPGLDLLVIDEAHHAAAPSYRRIIDQVRKQNPKVAIFGVTATPNRGDKKGLRPVFDNVADQISLAELIQAGHLVPPRTFVVDVGTQEALTKVKRSVDEFDMAEVDAIMNHTPINQAVVKHWKDKAGDRKTVVFCSTLNHARDVATAFNASDIHTVVVHGGLSKQERHDALAAYEKGDAQVVVNVAVLTEGWDYPPTSCVVLLRPSSYQSTLIQMIGRGLRTLDPNEYPGLTKTDCIVLDFGTSTLLHGSLEQNVDLDGEEADEAAPKKTCPDCEARIPLSLRQCPLCGFLWEVQQQSQERGKQEKLALDDFVMSEVDLFKRSSFLWSDLFGDDAALMATGFKAWAGVFFFSGGWHALGGGRELPTRLLAIGPRPICLARANDWLNEHETEDAARKSRRWLKQPATVTQLKYLPPECRHDFGLTRYHASCLLAFRFNKRDIQSRVFSATKQREVA